MVVLETKTPTAKKRHRCDFCGEHIEVGEVYENQTNIGDDGLYHWKSHTSCQQLVNELDMFKECDSNYGVTSDDFDEFVCQEYYNIMKTEIGNLASTDENITFKHKLNFVKDYYKII